MEAKDTVMGVEQIEEVEKPFDYEEWATQQVVDAYLKAQAEISFRAGKQEGIREVVEWLNAHTLVLPLPDNQPPIRISLKDLPNWRAKLKEWGIE